MKDAFITYNTPEFEREILTADDKLTLLNHLKKQGVPSIAGGLVKDMVLGIEIDLPEVVFDDGEFEWYTSTMYHFEKYDMKLAEEFVEHVLENKRYA